MKNKIIMVFIIIAVLMSFTACDTVETQTNTYLRPQGYVLVYVDCDGFLNGGYGYIKQEEYNGYLSGDLKGALVILHPYEKGKFITRSSNKIISIKIEKED